MVAQGAAPTAVAISGLPHPSRHRRRCWAVTMGSDLDLDLDLHRQRQRGCPTAGPQWVMDGMTVTAHTSEAAARVSKAQQVPLGLAPVPQWGTAAVRRCTGAGAEAAAAVAVAATVASPRLAATPPSTAAPLPRRQLPLPCPPVPLLRRAA